MPYKQKTTDFVRTSFLPCISGYWNHQLLSIVTAICFMVWMRCSSTNTTLASVVVLCVTEQTVYMFLSFRRVKRRPRRIEETEEGKIKMTENSYVSCKKC